MSLEPRKIAIFRIGHIGDTIIAFPALWSVRKRFPNAHIVYLTQQHQSGKLAQGLEVMRQGTMYDDVMTYRLGGGGVSKLDTLKTLLQLRLAKIDMLVYLPPFRTAAQLARDEKFFRLAGIKHIVGMKGYHQTEYRPPERPLKMLKHEADTLLSHLKLDGVFVEDDPHTLTGFGFSEEELKFADNWLAEHKVNLGRPVIAVAPASKMSAKVWPIDRTADVLRTIEKEYQPTFILFGGPVEKADCQTCCDAVSNAINTAGTLTVRQSASIMARCSLYFGIDSGPMHIAAAENVPCVAIFSARDWPGRWYPYGEGHVVHRELVPCEGCMLETCDKENLCLTKISTESVVASVRTKLDQIAKR